MDLYGDLYHLGEGLVQRLGEAPGLHKANPIIVGEASGRMHRLIMFDDTFADTLEEAQGWDWAILSGCTYWGRENSARRQSKLLALIFDLDGQTDRTMLSLMSGVGAGWYPMPSYVALSGHGAHLYYLLDAPLDLYPETKVQMKALKYALTDRLWNRYTSTDDHPQHQGINQGFRVVGGRTKVAGVRVRAWRMGDGRRHSVEELASYVPGCGVDLSRRWPERRAGLQEAARLWPDWYERVVVGGVSSAERWTVSRALYDWWLRRVEQEATPGHRYFCLMALAIFAVKCGVSEQEATRDALALVPRLNALDPTSPFTTHDARSALECYDERYVTFPRADLERLTGLSMPANKRNGRKQAQHMAYLNGLRRMRRDVLGEDEYAGAGRPTKADLVRGYAVEHPEASHSEIARALGVSRPTVIKWLKDVG